MSDLWGGRFSEPLDAGFRRFSTSLPVDVRLLEHDLEGSRAHAAGLHEIGLLSDEDLAALSDALDAIAAEARDGAFPSAGSSHEDVHSAVEARLVELAGDAGRRLHAGRSRNDQVVTDVLLWLREALSDVRAGLFELVTALADQAEAHASQGTLWSARTHFQPAQPVLLAHHLLAHAEALLRDDERLADAARRADRCPLGAGACVGSSLPLPREETAKRLGFSSVAVNSLDAVADRDWAIEAVSGCALLMTHLSRLAEEVVLFSAPEHGTVRLSDAWSTGSSMMPQKRNPDVAELVRGKSARVLGDLVALHQLLSKLPLAYNRDLQEDKEPLFDALDAARDCCRMMAGAVASATFRETAPAQPDFSAATDLAEELVRRGEPFRSAHEAVGKLVATLESSGRSLSDATDDELARAGLAGLDRALLTPRGSVEAKATLGSTSPRSVERQLEAVKQRLAGLERRREA